VVELVAKLRALGLLGDELLHTVNGREYVTPERLRADIAAALAAAGGRLEMVELPAAVGVDLLHCERAAAALVEGSGGSVVQARVCVSGGGARVPRRALPRAGASAPRAAPPHHRRPAAPPAPSPLPCRTPCSRPRPPPPPRRSPSREL